MPEISEICSRCGHEMGWAFRNFEYADDQIRHLDCPSMQPTHPPGLPDLRAAFVVLVDRVDELERQAAELMAAAEGARKARLYR